MNRLKKQKTRYFSTPNPVHQSLNPEEQELYHLNNVAHLREEGRSPSEITEILGLTLDQTHYYLSQLKSHPRRRPKH